MAAALKKGALTDEGYAQLIANTTKLNAVGTALSEISGVHALTDVTGFGLLGHLLEICRGAGLTGEVQFDQVPILAAALPLARQGYGPGAIERNMESYGKDVCFAEGIEVWQQRLLADAQTSGGLLVSVAPEAADQVLACFRQAGFEQAAVIGGMKSGEASVRVG